jgi:hypothetical protein
MRSGAIPFGIPLDWFHRAALRVFELLGAPFADVEPTHTLEHDQRTSTSYALAFAEPRPQTRCQCPVDIETTLWTDGARTIRVIATADEHVAMESTDRACFGIIDGLPDGVRLRAYGDDFGRLLGCDLWGDDEACALVELAWNEVIGDLARPHLSWHDGIEQPRAWSARARACPLVAPRTLTVEIGAWIPSHYELWLLHETPTGGHFGIAVSNYIRRDGRADLTPIGPLPGTLSGFRVRGLRDCAFAPPDPSFEELFAVVSGSALREPLDPWILRRSGTPAKEGTAWVQSEAPADPALLFGWRARRVDDGPKAGQMSGHFFGVLLGDAEALARVRARFEPWLEKYGFSAYRKGWDPL